jgi:dTDP-4-dehydrorhamnose 3,5-epimerase-like enzyme
MGLAKRIQVRPLEAMRSGMMEFYTPQVSHETMLVNVPAGTVDDLFVHRAHTDQLLVVRGSFVLVGLQERRYQYIGLSEYLPAVVTIPPGVLHGAINLGQEPCVVVNALLRHGDQHPSDYRPMRPPFPYDLEAARNAFERDDLSNNLLMGAYAAI